MNRKIRMALLVATPAFASSCAVGPSFHKPDAPANAAYAPTPLPEMSASAQIHGGEVQHYIAGRDIPFEWWELFQSPALNSLIEKAFKANPTIAAARRRWPKRKSWSTHSKASSFRRLGQPTRRSATK
jgi:outer membrane protein TolC